MSSSSYRIIVRVICICESQQSEISNDHTHTVDLTEDNMPQLIDKYREDQTF